jgi:hypothetical protein
MPTPSRLPDLDQGDLVLQDIATLLAFADTALASDATIFPSIEPPLDADPKPKKPYLRRRVSR